jgi:hypothetical protein
MSDNREMQFRPVEGRIVRDSPLKTLALCLLAIFVLAPVGVGLVWAWWMDVSFGAIHVSWYGVFIGVVLVLGGICAVPASVLCVIRRSHLILGKDCLQLVRGEKVAVQIPYENIAQVRLAEVEVLGKCIGIDLHDLDESQTLCPDAAATKNSLGWHYALRDESWTMPLVQIRDQIVKRLPSNPSSSK